MSKYCTVPEERLYLPDSTVPRETRRRTDIHTVPVQSTALFSPSVEVEVVDVNI